MSFWKSLFGPSAPSAPKESPPVEYNGFIIRAAPFKDGDKYQTAGLIEKEIAGVRKQHRFIRADSHASLDDATAFSLTKARQMIERIAHQCGVAAERGDNVGLDGRVVRAGHSVFLARRDDHGGNDT